MKIECTSRECCRNSHLIKTTVDKLSAGERQHDLQPKSVIRNFHSNRVHRVKRGSHFRHDM